MEWKLDEAEDVREQLTAEQRTEISMLYRQAYLKARKEISKLPPDGTTTQQLERMRLKQLEKQLVDAYKSIGVGLEKLIEKNALTVSEATVMNAALFPESFGLKIEGMYAFVPKDVIESIFSGKVYGGDWTLSSAIWSGIEKNQSDIMKIVAEGIAQNKGSYDIAKDLEKYVNPSARKDWDWSKVYPGTNKVVDYSAQRLARTIVSHAYQQSLERVCKNNPFVIGYIWEASGLERMCDICEDRDGQFFPKGDLPMDHPNGMCTFTATIQEDMNEISDRLGNWVNGADDPGIEKWYNDMRGISSSKPQNEQPSIGVPNKDTWINTMKDQDFYGIVKKEGEYFAQMPDDEKYALRKYTGSSFEWMNGYLRDIGAGMSKEEAIKNNHIDQDRADLISKVQAALKKGAADENMILRRGSDLMDIAGFLPGGANANIEKIKGMPIEGLNALFSGSVVEYHGFTSTSSDWNKGFSDILETIFFAPKGTQGSSITEVSSFGTDEGEFLLQAGTRGRVISIEESDGHKGSRIRMFIEILTE